MQEKKAREWEMSNTNDMFQVDYLPEKKEIRINLPEEVWENIDTVVMTRLFQEELVVIDDFKETKCCLTC